MKHSDDSSTSLSRQRPQRLTFSPLTANGKWANCKLNVAWRRRLVWQRLLQSPGAPEEIRSAGLSSHVLLPPAQVELPDLHRSWSSHTAFHSSLPAGLLRQTPSTPPSTWCSASWLAVDAVSHKDDLCFHSIFLDFFSMKVWTLGV